jgi:aspartate carbamoyltransferase catalytic subunit
MQWPLLGAADIPADDIDRLFAAADRFRSAAPEPPRHQGRVLATVFLEPSLRTRIGFQVAAARLGVAIVEVDARRSSPISSAESVSDTLRSLASWVDVIVARTGTDLEPDVTVSGRVRYINGGSRGTAEEHPTQALIDLYALRRLATQPVRRVLFVGDPTMRSARSLLCLLRSQPVDISVVTTDELATHVPEEGARVSDLRSACRDVDAVYVTGMRHESIPLTERSPLLLDVDDLACLPPHALVLSPMPVIDEIAAGARGDRRVRFFEQNDLGLSVRQALLDEALTEGKER